MVDVSHFPFFAAALVENGPRWTGRRPRGVPLITVMSAEEATRMRPRSAHGVIVSIRDPGAAPIPLNPRWEAVLRLELSDISWSGKNDPTPESLAEQAAALATFVHAHRKAPLIAFHCRAGISRSRTAAAVVCRHYEWPYDWYPLHYAFEVALQSAFADLSTRLLESLTAEFDATLKKAAK